MQTVVHFHVISGLQKRGERHLGDLVTCSVMSNTPEGRHTGDGIVVSDTLWALYDVCSALTNRCGKLTHILELAHARVSYKSWEYTFTGHN